MLYHFKNDSDGDEGNNNDTRTKGNFVNLASLQVRAMIVILFTLDSRRFEIFVPRCFYVGSFGADGR